MVIIRYFALNEKGKRIGESHQRAKYSDSEIAMIFELQEAGYKLSKIADKLEIPKNTVKAILAGRRRCQTIVGFREERYAEEKK